VVLATGLVLALVAGGVAWADGERPADRAGWQVVEYGKPIRSSDRVALQTAGAQAIQYLPTHSYVAWLDEGALRQFSLPGSARVRRLEPHEKVAPTVDAVRHPLLDVTVFGGRPEPAIAALERVTTVVAANAVSPGRNLLGIVVRAAPDDVPRIAELSEVLSVGPGATGIELLDEGTSQIVAGNIEGGRPVPGYADFLEAQGLDGSGVVIAIADSGIDDTHPDLADRVKARIDYTPLPDYRDQTDGHGTHVSGIVGGSGRGLDGANDPQGFAYGLGVAPNVEFLDLSVLGITEEIVGIDEFPPYEQVSRDAVRNGAIGWNASWGSGEGNRAGYTQTARTMDIITRDADWEAAGAQPFTLVFAAGNSGFAGPGAPTEAKNLIAVASSRSHRAGNIDTISSFSSRGPTLDFRIGPTVAAPGETVVSTRSLPASPLCNRPPMDPTPFAAFYGECSGTSMAAPHVTGAVALITQWWRMHRDGDTPSPAMHKAVLITSATDMGTSDIPNRSEGWGRVNLRALFDPTAERIYADQEVTLDEVGEGHEIEIRPVDPTRPLKATVVWSDAPATANAIPALVNDLDVTLTGADGTLYRGNHFADGWSVPGGAADRREVVENVFLQTAGQGSYTLRISAANLPGDGVPFSGDATDQDFALVISNAVPVTG
jgi:subtilisin family serine protease